MILNKNQRKVRNIASLSKYHHGLLPGTICQISEQKSNTATPPTISNVELRCLKQNNVQDIRATGLCEEILSDLHRYLMHMT